MSVFISDFSDPTSWTVVHDDAPGGSHQGTLDPAEITHSKNMDGSENHLMLVVNCPVCDSTSTHPVGGGANAPKVQELFVRKSESEGCPCGHVEADNLTVSEAHTQLNCERMDGIGRWQYVPDGSMARANPTQVEAQAQAGPGIFQVVYVPASGLIVGVGAKGGVGSSYRLAVIHDMAEYDVLLATDPAYLSQDGKTIVSTPRA